MKINDVVIAKTKSKKEFIAFLKELNIKGNKFIIKPNWVEPCEASFITADILDAVLSVLSGKKVVVESHTVWRNKFILKGETPITDKNMNEKKELIREQDKWFLKTFGFDKVLKKHKTEYVNITEENWAGRTVEPKVIKEIVEKKFKPVRHTELYSFVPKKLFNMRGAIMISLARVNTTDALSISITVKNFFGLIPDPSRYPKWHDKELKELPYNIIDINKIYNALFNVYAIADGTNKIHEGRHPVETKLVEWNIAIGGPNQVEVDAVIVKMMGGDPTKIHHLELARKQLKNYNPDILGKIPKKFIKPVKIPE